MRARRRLWHVARFAPWSGLLLASGCLARLERNLDFLLAPDALENSLARPFSAVAPYAQYLLRLIL